MVEYYYKGGMYMSKKEKEVWKTYPEYDWIQGSRFGEIRTVDHYVTRKDGKKRFVKGHVLPQHHLRNGYMQVSLTINGKTVALSVHRVIAMCFLPNPINLPEINHIDCDKTDNHLNNLEWCTRKYNIDYREERGTARNRPVVVINLETSEVLWFKSQMEASRQLKCSEGNIRGVIAGQRKQTKGFWFCRANKNSVEAVRHKFGDEVADRVGELIKDTKIQSV